MTAKKANPARSNCDIGPLTKNGAGKYHMPRLVLDVPNRVTNSSQREAYVPPQWPNPSNVNRRI